jgi:hypothetical protein
MFDAAQGAGPGAAVAARNQDRSAWPLETPAAMVPTPASLTSFTLIGHDG